MANQREKSLFSQRRAAAQTKSGRMHTNDPFDLQSTSNVWSGDDSEDEAEMINIKTGAQSDAWQAEKKLYLVEINELEDKITELETQRKQVQEDYEERLLKSITYIKQLEAKVKVSEGYITKYHALEKDFANVNNTVLLLRKQLSVSKPLYDAQAHESTDNESASPPNNTEKATNLSAELAQDVDGETYIDNRTLIKTVQREQQKYKILSLITNKLLADMAKNLYT